METIHNDYLTLDVSSLGAEIQSIRDAEDREYLWQADKDIWPRHSPILFPIVCGLWEGKYRNEGKEYALARHGFARDMEFKLLKKGDDKVTYVLESDEKTKESYPYDFILSITYRLEKNRIHVVWHVHNTGDKEMHFQIGGHPAFNVPGMEEGGPLKGAMIFDNKGLVERIYGNVGGCVRPERFDTGSRNGLWLFTEETFRDDAVIIDKCQLRQVCLIDKDQNPVVTVDFKAPAVGIWSPYGKQAPFVCIEPWYGLHDWVGYDGEFKDKYLMNHLQPGASFMSEYVITIG